MILEVKTADDWFAGTDSDADLVLLIQENGGPPQERRWALDTAADDFEADATDTFQITPHLPADTCNILAISIQKGPDDFDGGWKLESFRLIINGTELYVGHVNAWLEDNDRVWWSPDFEPHPCAFVGSFGSTGPLPPPLPNCSVNIGSVEFPALEPDADCDLIPDRSDPTFNPPDTDGDGLPDRTEDWNGNGIVDPGETDPNTPNKFSDLPDDDNDGLPNIFEDRNRNGVTDPGETNPTNPDSDGDGWADGPRNVRVRLFLVQIQCINSSEDTEFGDDEPFVTFNHARWPLDRLPWPENPQFDGAWEDMNGGSSRSPMIEVARRTRGPTPGVSFNVHVDLREDDWFDFTDDDFFLDRVHAFPESGLSQIHHLDEGFFNDVEYKLRFLSLREFFADPNPLDAGTDDDRDGLSETQEFQMVTELAGGADPAQPDIYMELDCLGSDQEPERYSKEDICSLFTHQGYAFHLDDGTFGGGEILPYEEHLELSKARVLRNSKMVSSRAAIFHYAVAVDVPRSDGSSLNGVAFRVNKDKAGNWLFGNGNTLIWKTDYLDHVSDFESIVWVHEFGHNLGLCHRPGEEEATAVGPGGSGGCTTPKEAAVQDCNCTHYTVPSDSDTAMGKSKGFLFNDAIDREVYYDPAEWSAIDLRHVGKPN